MNKPVRIPNRIRRKVNRMNYRAEGVAQRRLVTGRWRYESGRQFVR